MYYFPQSFVPVNDDAADPAEQPKRCPCLVLDVFDLNGTKFVELAYGTSPHTKANRGYEVRVNQTASCHAAGLDRPSRFVCARRVIVSVNHPGFDGGDNRGTLIGRLDPPLIERMNDVRARIQAEADIHAESLRGQREDKERWQREEHGFLLRNRASREATPLKLKGGLS